MRPIRASRSRWFPAVVKHCVKLCTVGLVCLLELRTVCLMRSSAHVVKPVHRDVFHGSIEPFKCLHVIYDNTAAVVYIIHHLFFIVCFLLFVFIVSSV